MQADSDVTPNLADRHAPADAPAVPAPPADWMDWEDRILRIRDAASAIDAMATGDRFHGDRALGSALSRLADTIFQEGMALTADLTRVVDKRREEGADFAELRARTVAFHRPAPLPTLPGSAEEAAGARTYARLMVSAARAVIEAALQADGVAGAGDAEAVA